MHYIQKHILDTLRTVDAQHYAALNQDEIESGHFRYHLMQLLNDGYVASRQRGIYQLTPAGKRFVDRLSERVVNASLMPKVITYTLLTDGESIILQEKQKEPYLHLINMIGGKLHYGETSVQSAAREVQEKTGVTIERPELVGIFEILIRSNGELYTHVIAYVHRCEVDSDAFSDVPVTAINVKDIPSISNFAPDFIPIYTLIKNTMSICSQTLILDVEAAS